MANAAWSPRNVLSVALIIVCLLSCQDGVVTFTGGTAMVRIFNAQTKVSSIDLIVDSVRVINQLVPGALSNVVQVPSGAYVLIEAYGAESTSPQRIASQRYVMADKQSYTIVVRGQTITDFLRPIVDTLVSPFSDYAAIKIINATEETFVTVTANDSTIGFPIVDAQTVMPYVPVPSGSIRISVRDVDRGVPIATDSTVVLERGACYYLFVHDVPGGSNAIQRWLLWKVE